jgi:lipid-A-disaccharide synthase
VSARVLISAGEASGDLYAAALATKLSRDNPGIELFGCAGPRMRVAGVEAVVESESLAVVGLLEVVAHIPRIYREYRKLVKSASDRRPEVAVLTDSPDFHFRVARRLKKLGIPVVYLVAPQVWAWRKGRLPQMRRYIDRLLCIFPFEKDFFEKHGIKAEYLGHPLTRMVRASASRMELRRRLGVPDGAKLIAVLPGSREGEIKRHLPVLIEAVKLIQRKASGTDPQTGGLETCFTASLPPRMAEKFRERFLAASIQVQEGQTWDVLACSDLALAASGTVTIEACLLNTPMVAFYRVNRLSWLLGKLLVRVPFYSMVNLVAGRRVVPELIQSDMTAAKLAAEALSLLERTNEMREELALVAGKLSGPGDPMEAAASVVTELLEKEMVHAS